MRGGCEGVGVRGGCEGVGVGVDVRGRRGMVSM